MSHEPTPDELIAANRAALNDGHIRPMTAALTAANALRDRAMMLAEARATAAEAALSDQQIRTEVAETAAHMMTDRANAAEAAREAADGALQAISLSLGTTDEWSDQAQMIADVTRQVRETKAALEKAREAMKEMRAIFVQHDDREACIRMVAVINREIGDDNG